MKQILAIMIDALLLIQIGHDIYQHIKQKKSTATAQEGVEMG